VSALARWWFVRTPVERLAAFRILLGIYATIELAARAVSLFHYARFPLAQWKPVGVAALLERPLPPLVADALLLLTIASAVAFTLGWRFAITGPLFAALYLWTLTYRNSWGMVFHTENVAVLHACILGLAPAADAWSLDPRRNDREYGWALRAAAVVTILTYVLAGIAKLRLAGWLWLDGDQLRNQIAYDNLRRVVLGGGASPLATPLLEHPWIFQVLALATLAVELGAPLALLHPRAALAWAAAAWGFHVGVLALMQIVFPYPLVGLAFAPLFPLERLIRARRRSAPGSPR
jgi:hypothetical protein